MIRDGEKIGIVGAGISGVTLAYELGKKGYRHVTIMEQGDRVGGKCHSIEYKGKTYEMGTLIGLPSYKMTMKLMEEFDLQDKGPLLDRGFFNRDGYTTSQIPVEQLSDFAREFKHLPELLGRYEFIKAPGFANIPLELCKPFAAWCDENGLFVLKQVFMHYFSAFGFGSIDEVPAAYVLKLLNYDNLMSQASERALGVWPFSSARRLTCSPSWMFLLSRNRLKFGSVSAREPDGTSPLLLLYFPVRIPPASGKYGIMPTP